MSRIGKRPVKLEKGATAKIEGGRLSMKGPKGELHMDVSDERFPGAHVAASDGSIVVTRREETRRGRTEQGLVRALIQNMLVGVTHGYSRTLDIVGVGYKAEVKGRTLNLNLGFSHPIEFPLPEGINVNVEKQTRMIVSGIDKKLVGEVASMVRRFRPPEPYKGKGVRYADEYVRRKVGKAAAGTATGAGGG